MSIPIIGALCLIRVDLLKRLINSVDYPVDSFIILLQSPALQLDLNEIKNVNIKKFVIINASFNIGVGRGWNYIIRNFPADYWIIAGDDTYFEGGSLKKIAECMTVPECNENVYIEFNLKTNNSDEVIPAGYATFILTNKIHDKVGLFDENIYPAYFEDDDYRKRVERSGEKYCILQDVYIRHGHGNTEASLTLHSVDSNYKQKMNRCFCINEKYFNEKWKSKDLSNAYLHPFNNNKYQLNQIISHRNYYDNQIILLGHKKNPEFEINIYINCKKFNVKIYKFLILSSMFGLSDDDAKKHFVNIYCKKNKEYKNPLPLDFDINTYRSFNKDLQNKSDIDVEFHYIEYGREENRKYKFEFPEDFDVFVYKHMNSDLRFMTDSVAKKHFIEYGHLENRVYKYDFPEGFDVSVYKKMNNDLKDMSDDEAKKHFMTYGYLEDRVYKVV